MIVVNIVDHYHSASHTPTQCVHKTFSDALLVRKLMNDVPDNQVAMYVDAINKIELTICL